MNSRNIVSACLILIFWSWMTYAQEFDPSDHEQFIEVAFPELPQTVYLIKNKDGTYQGSIITELSIAYPDSINSKHRVSTELKDQLDLDTMLVIDLIQQMEEAGIYKIIDHKPDMSAYSVHGSHSSISFVDNGVIKGNSFTNINYVMNLSRENKISSNRLIAIRILDTINDSLDMESKFLELISQLPLGVYQYINDMTIVSVSVEDKKQP